jgi:thiosulfate dehydrogenase
MFSYERCLVTGRPARSVGLLSLFAVFSIACAGGVKESTPYQQANLTRGGRLYDNWMKEKGVTPTSKNPGYALTSGKSTSVTATWRCNECHGWDYRGIEGVYAAGTHFTGVEGLLEAARDAPDELFNTIRDGVDGQAMSSFATEQFTDSDVWDLVKFIKEGTVNLASRIDGTGALVGADAAAGRQLFEHGPGNNAALACASCHGADGREVNFHVPPQAPEYLGTVASNPWEFQHHVRFGYAGGLVMPSFNDHGMTIANVLDVLAYVQTLPTQ